MNTNEVGKHGLHIKEIKIDGLFYKTRRIEISCPSRESPIGVLTGDNGSGKTTIFRMLWSIFSEDEDFQTLAYTPFSVVTLLWSDDSELHFVRELAHDGLWATIRVALRKFVTSEEHRTESVEYLSGSHRLPYPEQVLETVETKRFRQQQKAESSEGLSEEDRLLIQEEQSRLNTARELLGLSTPSLKYRGGRRSNGDKRHPKSKDATYIEPHEALPNQIDELLRFVSIDLIGTDRTVVRAQPSRTFQSRLKRESTTISDNLAPIEELSSRIESILYNCDADPPDASDLLQILSKQEPVDSNSVPMFWERIDSLLERCEELIRFEIEVYSLRRSLTRIRADLMLDAPERVCMALHFVLVETERRISELELTKKRVERFLQLVNELFHEKQIFMEYGRIAVKSDLGKTYPLSALSSGEQHLVVLLGRLLFPEENRGRIRPTEALRIVLIDEPEISLHIKWQYAVRDALLELTRSTATPVIVATHSLYILTGLDSFESDLSAR